MQPFFDTITLAADLRGCPNRCLHCWMGHRPNPHLGPEALREIAADFRPYARRLVVEDWNREPDYPDNYREMWALCSELSDGHGPHFELMSVWRAARDESYIPWLRSLGVRAVQLTFFGGRAATDRYTGRPGAYDDLLWAVEALLRAGIAPRIQSFLYRDTVNELPHLQSLLADLDLDRRCARLGVPFDFFLHQGSCDGAAEALYPLWPTPADLEQVPEDLAARTCRHFGKASLRAVFGDTEADLCRALAQDTSTHPLELDDPVFFVDGAFNVYPNRTAPSPGWLLGNLRTQGPQAVLETYLHHRSPAQRILATVPICDLVRAYGDPESQRLFGRGDYLDLLVNRMSRA